MCCREVRENDKYALGALVKLEVKCEVQNEKRRIACIMEWERVG